MSFDRDDPLGYVSDSEVEEDEIKSDAESWAGVRAVEGIPISSHLYWSPEMQKRLDEFIVTYILPQKIGTPKIPVKIEELIVEDSECHLDYVSDSEVEEDESKSDDPCATVRAVAGNQSFIPSSCYPRCSPESQKRTEEFIAKFILPQPNKGYLIRVD
ncbi:unnamed protein product [Cuscuta epithymum]|uniref:Uncharacterized protein n=1 Tax=Cuscuta epithymum TaxID=186058 RepID=A0AAV0EZF5_9ASTE|nr:unnamed protein product [Cuscuta epithymum]